MHANFNKNYWSLAWHLLWQVYGYVCLLLYTWSSSKSWLTTSNVHRSLHLSLFIASAFQNFHLSLHVQLIGNNFIFNISSQYCCSLRRMLDWLTLKKWIIHTNLVNSILFSFKFKKKRWHIWTRMTEWLWKFLLQLDRETRPPAKINSIHNSVVLRSHQL